MADPALFAQLLDTMSRGQPPMSRGQQQSPMLAAPTPTINAQPPVPYVPLHIGSPQSTAQAAGMSMAPPGTTPAMVSLDGQDTSLAGLSDEQLMSLRNDPKVDQLALTKELLNRPSTWARVEAQTGQKIPDSVRPHVAALVAGAQIENIKNPEAPPQQGGRPPLTINAQNGPAPSGAPPIPIVPANASRPFNAPPDPSISNAPPDTASAIVRRMFPTPPDAQTPINGPAPSAPAPMPSNNPIPPELQAAMAAQNSPTAAAAMAPTAPASSGITLPMPPPRGGPATDPTGAPGPQGSAPAPRFAAAEVPPQPDDRPDAPSAPQPGAPTATAPAAPSTGELDAASRAADASGNPRIPELPMSITNPDKANAGNGTKNFYNGLLDFGLATMAAGRKEGANTLSAIGEGGMYALNKGDQRKQRDRTNDIESATLQLKRGEVIATLQQRADGLAQQSADRQLSIQQRAEAAAQHQQTLTLIAAANADTKNGATDERKFQAELQNQREAQRNRDAADARVSQQLDNVQKDAEATAAKNPMSNPDDVQAQIGKRQEAILQANPNTTAGRDYRAQKASKDAQSRIEKLNADVAAGRVQAQDAEAVKGALSRQLESTIMNIYKDR